ncbi:unnamed protein product [Prorocentrum cordatum]|uniref:Alpha-carbonic anhydrase domain-containing protein n=1 Tax=Prorocentrum cordatum TaxID=2364126 RepID=A0ABN9UL74_9DINO|nr:unnamed protein product [Polarella glacialis]
MFMSSSLTCGVLTFSTEAPRKSRSFPQGVLFIPRPFSSGPGVRRGPPEVESGQQLFVVCVCVFPTTRACLGFLPLGTTAGFWRASWRAPLAASPWGRTTRPASTRSTSSGGSRSTRPRSTRSSASVWTSRSSSSTAWPALPRRTPKRPTTRRSCRWATPVRCSRRPPAVLDALRQGGLPQEEGAETLVNGDSSVFVDLARAFQPLPGQAGAAGGGGQAFWQYTGSLTSPPCTADVQWFVRSSPLPARPDALEAYRRALQAGRGLERAAEAGNARALQPSCGARLTRWAAEAAFQDSAAEEKESNEAAFRRAEADNVGNEDALANAIGGTGPVSTAESQARLDYERCAQAIASSEAELQGAARQAAAECDGAVATASYLGEVGTEASGALNSVQQAQCASSQAVAARLRIQAEVQKRTCRALKRKADAAQR